MISQESFGQMSSLAAGLCLDADISLEFSPRAKMWAWDPIRRLIVVPVGDLQARGPEYCAGVLAHEVSHYYISRYAGFFVTFPCRPVLRLLLNALEDPRANTWICRRYPGTAPWVQEAARVDLNRTMPMLQPAVFQFTFECACEEWRDWSPAPAETLLKEVERALEETRSARRAFAGTLPPANLNPSACADLLERYRCEVLPMLLPGVSHALPSSREQMVRLSAQASLELAQRHILPAAKRLFKNDLRRTAHLLGQSRTIQRQAMCAIRDEDGRAVQEICAQAAQLPFDPAAPTPQVELRVLALALLEVWVKDWCTRQRGSPLADSESRCGSVAPPTEEASDCRDDQSGAGDDPTLESLSWWRGQPLRHRIRRTCGPGVPMPLQPVPPTPYDAVYQSIASQVQQLATTIEGNLQPTRRLRYRRGYSSGDRLDLQRLMKFEADYRDHEKLWQRKLLPARWNAVFSLLIDLSGSMAGPKVDAALAGAVLLAETLHRIQAPFIINGFQDVLIPFCGIDDGLTDEVRERLSEMPNEAAGNRPGGNNRPSYNDDGPCVLAAAAELLDHAYDERMLIVISDGMPEGAHSKPDDLHRAVTELAAMGNGLQLIGIGLGPGTEHVQKFYPNSVANVPVERLAEEIGRVVNQVLLPTRESRSGVVRELLPPGG